MNPETTTLAEVRIIVQAREQEIRTLGERQKACERGTPYDTAPLSFYAGMIPVKVALLAEWLSYRAQLERKIVRA